MKSVSTFKNVSDDDIWNSENIYHLKTNITRIPNLINHYELYKKIISLPGDVVECGVFKGISLTRILTFREMLENCNSRKIYGFDVFGKFPKPKNQGDKSFLKRWEKSAGDGIDVKELNDILLDKKFSNFELVKGDVKKTIPNYFKKNKNFKISFLHLDMDVFEPTKFALDHLFNKVSKNGIILIDDYNNVRGATKAIKLFLKNKASLRIQKLKFNKRLSFLRK